MLIGVRSMGCGARGSRLTTILNVKSTGSPGPIKRACERVHTVYEVWSEKSREESGSGIAEAIP